MARVLVSIGLLQVLTMLVALLRAKALSWQLGPAGFGIISTIEQVVLTVVQVGALGVPFTGLRFIARAHSEGVDAFHAAVARFLRLLGSLAFGTALVALMAVILTPRVLGDELITYRGIVLLAFVAVPGTMLHILFVNVLAAAQRGAAAAALNLVVATSLAMASVVGVLVGGIAGLFAAVAIASMLALGMSLRYLCRTIGLRLRAPALTTQPGLDEGIVRTAAYVYVTLITYSVSLLVVRYVVFVGLGEVAAGLLQASLSIALSVGAALGPLSNLYLTPILNRRASAAEKVHFANEFVERMLLILLLGALPAVLFPELLLTALYTPEFTAVAGTMFLFVLWQCVYQIANVYQQLLIGLHDVGLVAAAASAGYAASALLSLLLVPRWGIAGAAAGLTIGMLAYGLAVVGALAFRHGVRLPRRVLLRAAYVCGVIVAAGWSFADVREGAPLPLALRAAAFLLSLAGLWTLLTGDERAIVRRFRGMVAARLGVGPFASSS